MIKLTKVVIGLLFYIYFSGFAQNPIKTGSIPINPALKQGVLQNGLQYYIMRDTDNALNKGRIAMRLVVKAGNLHEDADQLDMGHLVEHIGMRSSENFPLGIMRYFNSLPKKVDIGASTNATTNYYLTIPSGDEALLNKGILAMHDCAGGMSMLPSEIEEERSAVYREYMNANTPAFLADVNLIYQQWDKNPVYKPRVLEVLQSVMNAPLSSMYRFYHDWYHPRYQAVIVVGDLDVVEVEHLIKKHLSSLSNEGIRPQKDVKRLYDIKLSGKDRLFISDKGKGRPGILIKVAKKSKHDVNLECPSTINEVKTILIYDLATKMLKYRMQSNPSLKQITLQVQTRAVANPYLSALYAESRVNQVSEIEPILLQVLREMRRVSLYGFSEPEFARARAIINAERQQTKVNYVTALLNCVECGTVFSDKDLSAKILSSISLSEINQTIVPRISQKGNTDFVLEGSETKSLKLPTEKEILSMLHTVSQEKLQPYIDPAIKELPAIVKGADLKDCKITEISGSGATKVLLPNGATVILKSLSEDQSHEQGISIRGFSKNVNEAITNDPELALLSSRINSYSGIGGLSRSELSTWLNEKSETEKGSKGIFVRARVTAEGAEIGGNGGAKSVLQLVNLYMTRALLDKDAFMRVKSSFDNDQRLKKTADEVLGDSINSSMHLYPPNYSHVSMNTLKLDQAFSIYKGEFAKTADFTFVIVGSFNKAEMLQLLAQFIGSLPASNPSKVHIPEKGPVEYQGDIKQKEFKSSNRLTLVRDYSGNINVRILFRARAIENTRNELIMEVTNRIIQSLLFKRLREQDKGVYGVLTNLRKGGQSEEFFLDVDFETAPFDVNRMIAAVENELQQLSLATPDEGLFLNALASVKNATQQRMNSHVFWYTYLLESAKKDQFNPENLKRIEILETIKPVDITNIMCNSFNLEPYRIFELL